MGVKISNLPAIVTPALSDVFPVVQAGVTYKESFTQLSSLFATAGANTNITSLSGISSITFTPTTGGIVGTPTNDNAGAGKVGEVLTSTAGPVALGTGVSSNVTSLAITAGDWDVYGSVLFEPAGATTAVAASISVTSAVLGGSLATTNFQTTFGTTNQSFPVPYQRLSLAGTTTYYLVAQASFATGCDVTGVIYARRAR